MIQDLRPPHPQMTSDTPDDLMHALATELDSIGTEQAEKLCNILRGLFACMQDLNHRLARLEGQHGGSPGAEN
jgi:hypothetical protein